MQMNRNRKTISFRWRIAGPRHTIHRIMVLAAAAMAMTMTAAIAPACAQTEMISSHPYAAQVAHASQRFGIPENWIWSVMRIESGGNPRARSRAGAMGLMQIMPATWDMLTTRFALGTDPFDISANIHAGAAYLRLMWDRYGTISAMLAAYNAGPKRADAWVAGRRALPQQTAAYVARLVPIGDSGARHLPAVAPLPDSHGWRRSVLFAPRSTELSGEDVRRENAPDLAASRIEPNADAGSQEPLFAPLVRRIRP